MRAWVIAATLVGSGLAHAEGAPPPPWAEARGDLDGDGRPELARLERDGTLTLTGADGRERGRVPLVTNPREIAAARLELVTVEEHRLLHARARKRAGRAEEAVLGLSAGGVETLFVGPTGPVGDGDRRVQLSIEPEGLVRYQTSPTVARCDGNDLLFPERWDFAARRFRPVEVEPPEGRALAAQTAAPQALKGEPVPVFHFEAASTDRAAASERRADLLAAPKELEDRKPETLWVAGPAGGGRGSWVTARAQHPIRVTGLRVVAGNGSGKGAPRELALVLGAGDGESYRVRPPAQGTGSAFWVALPSPQTTACVSLVVAEPSRPETGETALAEVAIYTDADASGGLERLAQEIGTERAGAEAAAHTLMAQGAQATPAVVGALEAAQGAGRRRLLEVLAALGDPQAAPALGRALETAAAEERAAIVAGLSRLGERGAGEAARIYGDRGQAGEARADAAKVLGAIAAGRGAGAAEALKALLDGAGSGKPGVRRVAVAALAKAGQANPEARAGILGALRGEIAPASAAPLPDPPASSRVEGNASRVEGNSSAARVGDLGRALGAAARGEGRAEAAEALGTAYRAVRRESGQEGFEVRFRLLRAMGELGDPQQAAVLGEAAREPEELVRFAAVAAAGQLADGAGRPVLESGARDADPRVRRAALEALGRMPDAPAAHLLASALGGDHWPQVRRSAAEALGRACAVAGTEDALERAAAGDPGRKDAHGADAAEDVRRAALVSVGRCSPRSPAIARVLAAPDQPIAVRELAAALTAKQGGREAAERLAHALDDVLADPAADERTAGLAVACVRGLARAGDTSRPVLESLGAASNEPLSPAVRAAAMETIGALCPEGASVALKRGAEDGDGNVRQAAARALDRCKR